MTNPSSPNYDERPAGVTIDTLVLHYTGMPTGNEALERLCNPEAKVSCHFFVDEDGKILELVPCHYRAWHAGKSIWRGKESINDNSIGIEIVNPGHEFGYREFFEPQMQSVVTLCKKFLSEYPIDQHNVVAHSDIAPDRKQDPGELFDWRLLADNGIGIWADVSINDSTVLVKLDDSGNEISELQRKLAHYGYGINETGEFDKQTEFVVKAFERHFGERTDIQGKWTIELGAKLDYLLKLC